MKIPAMFKTAPVPGSDEEVVQKFRSLNPEQMRQVLKSADNRKMIDAALARIAAKKRK